MQYTYPDYYKEFTCIAGECPATCCAGWQIVIDDESIERYKKIIDSKDISGSRSFADRLKNSIDWEEEVFKQGECRRCAFLNKENLCDLYTSLGEESLCHTCATYPRHIEEFEDLREITLSLSCPEVARILMGKLEKVSFYEEETSEEEDYDDYEDFDSLMFGILQDIRSDMISIMQDREIPVESRMKMIWLMALKIQGHIDNGDVFACEDVLEEYRLAKRVNKNLPDEQADNRGDNLGDNHTDSITDKLKSNSDNKNMATDREKGAETGINISYNKALDLYKSLYRLEILDEAWEIEVDEASLTLFGKDNVYYEKLQKEFRNWLEENMNEWQIQAEQIVVYFISTYLCGAVYDGLVSSKVRMAVVSFFFIHEVLMAKWLKQGKKLTFDDIVNVVYRYSRELEHSDINLEELENCLLEF